MSEQLVLIPPAATHQQDHGSSSLPETVGAANNPGRANPASPSSAAPSRRVRHPHKGLPPAAFALGSLAVGALLWGAWVTKSILDPAVVRSPIASVRLEQIIGEYVQLQARSETAPELVGQQMQTFMTVLGEELKARGSDGTTVMVAEAVLSQNVPDITDDVRRVIYSKVPPPAVPAAHPPSATPNGAPLAPPPATLGQ